MLILFNNNKMRVRPAYAIYNKFKELNNFEKYLFVSVYIIIPTHAVLGGVENTIYTYKMNTNRTLFLKSFGCVGGFILGFFSGAFEGVFVSVFWPVMLGIYSYEKIEELRLPKIK